MKHTAMREGLNSKVMGRVMLGKRDHPEET